MFEYLKSNIPLLRREFECQNEGGCLKLRENYYIVVCLYFVFSSVSGVINSPSPGFFQAHNMP